MDKIKMTLAVALVVAGVWGYYYFSDAAQVLRVLMVLGGLVAAIIAGTVTTSAQIDNPPSPISPWPTS